MYFVYSTLPTSLFRGGTVPGRTRTAAYTQLTIGHVYGFVADYCLYDVRTPETASKERARKLQRRREQARARRASETAEHREERLRNRRVSIGPGALIRRLPRLLRRERPDYKQPEIDEQLSHQRRERDQATTYEL